MLGLTNLFTTLGWSRDDWKWTWGQIVGVAGLILTGVFDVQHWIEYLGLSISTQHLHWVQAAAAFVMWLSGQMNSSGLYSKKVMDAAKATQLPPEVVSKQVVVEQAKEIATGASTDVPLALDEKKD